MTDSVQARREAQLFFDQGIQLMYAFDPNLAARSFREAWKLDPNCAMCAWGEALVLVGAPRDQNLQPGTNRSGALWKCPLNNDINVSLNKQPAGRFWRPNTDRSIL